MLIALALVVLGAVVTLALVVAVVSRTAGGVDVDVTRFDRPVRTVTCSLDAGNVEVIATAAGGTVVRRTIRHGRRRPSTEERLDGDHLVVEARRPGGWWRGWWWVDYEIHVPATASVQAHTAAGRLGVSGVCGAIELTTDAGKIRVHDTSGTLRLRTAAGAIEGDALHSPEVDIRTEAGHVVCTFDAPPARVDVTATAGAIELRLPGGPYAVDASSAAGRSRVSVPTDPASTRRVLARSMAGSVQVGPTGPGAERVAAAAAAMAAAEPVDDGGADPVVEVTMERIDEPAGAALVAALLAELYDRYGEEDADAPDADALVPPAGAFLVARIDGRPVGCGGLRGIEPGLGELKRMYVVPDARRTGVAARLLRMLEARAQALGYERLRLETGVRQPEAIALYERNGYERVANFPPYERAPMSVCFEKRLPPPA